MKRNFKIHKLAGVMLVLSFFCCSLVSARIIYVDDDVSGQNDGSSWENAYNYLQDALFEATTAEKPIEIRVAQGIYTPDKGVNVEIEDIYASFEMLNGVTLSGGYAGLADSGQRTANSKNLYAKRSTLNANGDPDARDIELYQSILSGDLLNNDSNNYDPNNLVNDPNFFDNSYHVITYISDFSVQSSESNNTEYRTQNTELRTQNEAVLDGFTITAGNARGYNYYYLDFDSTSRGGGIYIESAIGGPVITNCTFTINAAYEGGAIYNTNSDPNISNCKFIKNSSNYFYEFTESPVGGSGGAIYNFQSNIILTNCEFTDNLASSAAAIYNRDDSNGVLTNCKFIRNTANLGNGGAIINRNYSSPFLNGCTFQENWAINSGGAVYNFIKSEPNITNCSFINNSSNNKGGAIANNESDPYFMNCTFSGNHSYSGGGFDNSYGNPTLSSCVFSNNYAGNGGAIVNILGNPVLENCIFSGNYDRNSAGAVFNTGGYLKARNCTFTGNYSEQSCDAIQNKRILFISIEYPDRSINIPGSIDILNCIIWNGPTAISNLDFSDIFISYCDIYGGKSAINDPSNSLIWGHGNIDDEPFFVKDGLWIDVNDPNIVVEPNDPNAFWLEGDYHLQSTAGHYDPNSQTWILDDLNSPCIDAGDPNSPFENEPLPNGGRINMGAFGGTTQASKSQESIIAYKEPDDS